MLLNGRFVVDQDMKERLRSKDRWLRILYMLIFAVVNYFLQILVWIIAGVQFILDAIVNKPNKNLLHFGDGLSRFSYQILEFLTYNTEEKPFPFSPWPTSSKEKKAAKVKKSKPAGKSKKGKTE